MSLLNVSNFLKLIGATAVTGWAYLTLTIYLRRRKYRHIPGPETNGILEFYLGQLPEVFKLAKEGKIFADKLPEWEKKYGPVFKVQFINIIFVFTSDTSAIKEILITKNYPKPLEFMNGIMFPYNERYLGYGLVTDTDTSRWKHRRAFFNNGFHRHILMNFVGQFNTKADILMEKLTKLADGKTLVNLFKEINRATLDAIALIAFGMNIDSINDENSPFNLSVSETLRITNEYLKDPFGVMNVFKWREVREFKKHVRFLRNTGKEKILERIEMLKNQDPNLPNDILTDILKANKDDSLDIEMMIDDFITFFIAGQETTANTLGFCFLELGKNTELADKARKEISEVLGERTEITYQDISKLKYCSCIFKEALRIHTPVVIISRSPTENMVINGVTIPNGTTISLSSYMNARIPRYFPNPFEFKPERFLKDTDTMENSIENYTYFPFSLGPRNCIGQNFAQIEGIIMIAKFLQRFDYKLDPTQSWHIEQTLTVHPTDGARSFLTLRG